MRYLLFLLLPLFLLAEEEEQPSFSLWDYHPLHIGGNTLWLGNANVDSDAAGNGHLYFQKNNLFLTMLTPISMTSYFFPRVEWVNFTLNWNKNPKFHETHFNYAQFGLTFYTKAVEDWRWILRATYNIDVDHFTGSYGQFCGLAWGSYTLNEEWHYHVGALGFLGLEEELIYPIIGLDYSLNSHWTFEAIFPIAYSIQYKFNKNWRLSAQGRPLKERFRVGKYEPQPRSIFNYSSMGAELNLHYELPMHLEIEVYGG